MTEKDNNFFEKLRKFSFIRVMAFIFYQSKSLWSKNSLENTPLLRKSKFEISEVVPVIMTSS